MAFLTTGVRAPSESNWAKSLHDQIMKWLKKIQEDCLTLGATNDLMVKWYVVKYVVPHMWYVVKYIKHLKIN
jgi:hypothetical protein